MISNKKETTLLDSSLNTATLSVLPCFVSHKNYNIKVIKCKDYLQLYLFDRTKIHNFSGNEKDSIFDDLHRANWEERTSDTSRLRDDHIARLSPNESEQVIEDNDVLFKNVMRSKLNLQRLAKANADAWKTFITLTFKNDITDLSSAYKKFRNFITIISRSKKDFKWLCVPEFQKNGRVHYHLITNIDLTEDSSLLYVQLIKDKDGNDNSYYHLKNWSKSIEEYIDENGKIKTFPTGIGWDSIELVKDKDGNDTKKICGYISKYMTKAYIESVFYGRNRYYSSQNLERPTYDYYDLDDLSDLERFKTLTKDFDVIFTRDYLDVFNNTIQFVEMKK